MDERERGWAVDGVAAGHRWLCEDVLARPFDPHAPSRLPEWTVGHLLTHLARNADSMVRAVTGAERGAVAERYPGGPGTRDAEIAAGADRPAAALVTDVCDTAAAVDAAFAATTRWDGRTREADGRATVVDTLPARRWREVLVHAVDLGLGAEPADWPSLFVRLELRTMEMRWRAARPLGLTGLPAEALALDPPTRLAWLYGRVDVDGLARPRLL